MANIFLSAVAANALSEAIIAGRTLRLPKKLHQNLYAEVDAALKLLGGKWNTAREAHVFKADPSELVAAAINGAEIIDQKKLFQEFYTPDVLAARAAKLAQVEGMSVLEPSAGRGALAKACRNAGAASVRCVEQREDSIEMLAAQGFESHQGDFLDFTERGCELHPALGVYDRVVMNPPFSKGSAEAHLRHGLTFLKPNGVLVAIVPVKGGERDSKRFLPIVPDGFVGVLEVLPANSFKDSGTSVETGILRIEPASENEQTPILRYVDPEAEARRIEVDKRLSVPRSSVEEIVASLERSLRLMLIETRAMMDGDRHIPALHELSTAIHGDIVQTHIRLRQTLRQEPQGTAGAA